MELRTFKTKAYLPWHIARHSFLAFALAGSGCSGGSSGNAMGTGSSSFSLSTTEAGALYHTENCISSNTNDKLVVFIGLGQFGDTQNVYQTFLGLVGNRTGLCTLGVPYSGNPGFGACCTIQPGVPDGLQDAACLEEALGAKSRSVPPVHTCTDGSSYEVPRTLSAEGSVATALEQIGLTSFYTGSGQDLVPEWSRIVLVGHSQSAMLSSYIAIARHALRGVGALAGGSLATVTGEPPYLPYVFSETPLTPPSAQRAFHHINDADAPRRVVYDLMGLPTENVRSSENQSTTCMDQPHSCVIVDSLLPMDGDTPVFLDDWLWLVGE